MYRVYMHFKHSKHVAFHAWFLEPQTPKPMPIQLLNYESIRRTFGQSFPCQLFLVFWWDAVLEGGVHKDMMMMIIMLLEL
jgi:hypothetical protein